MKEMLTHRMVSISRHVTNLCSEHRFPMHVGLELEIHTVGHCGSDMWHIGLHEG